MIFRYFVMFLGRSRGGVGIDAANWLFTVGNIDPIIEFTIDLKVGRFMLISEFIICVKSDVPQLSKRWQNVKGLLYSICLSLVQVTEAKSYLDHKQQHTPH